MFKIYTTLFTLIFFNLSADILQRIEVKGNSRISPETIKVYGEITIGKDYTAFEIDKILKDLYKTDFFKDIKISLSEGVMYVSVEEYPIINFIGLEGEKSNARKEKILEQLQLKSNESFIENKLSEDVNFLKKIYESLGFNFIKVETKVEKFDNNRINLVYVLEKGNKSKINKINFIGDKKIKEKRLREIIASEENKFWKVLSKNTSLNYANIELDKRLLINYYKTLGYYDVQVLSNNAEVSRNNLTNLTYTINAGSRYRVNKISTNVSDVLDKKLFIPLQDSFSKIIGRYYSPFTVKKLLDELDLLIANNDLQFIEHSVNEILENESIEIKINIYEGKKQLVEKINISGNTVTDESVIRSALLLDEGDPFNKLKLTQSIAKLKSKNIFGEIKNKITDGVNVDQKIIDIEVEEKPTGEISAGAGIGTNGASLQFNVTENNWLGRGMSVSMLVDISAETFSGGIEVTDPNYKFSGNSLTYFVKNTANDKPDSGYKNRVISTGIGTKFEQYTDLYLSPNLVFTYDDLEVASGGSSKLKKQEGSFTDFAFDYGITLDKRDKAYAPTNGYVSSFSQAVPIYADSPYLKNSYQFKTYKSFSEDAIGSFKIYGATINGLSNKDVRLNKRINLSSRRLRGFESGKIGPKDGKDFVGGNYAVASNFELSLPRILPEATKTDVGLYLDFGSVWEVDYDPGLGESNKIRSSAGILTNWLSPVGPMSFVFSQNLSKAKTDITESFNFRLGTTF